MPRDSIQLSLSGVSVHCERWRIMKKRLQRISRLIWCVGVVFTAMITLEVGCLLHTLFPFSGAYLTLLLETVIFAFTAITGFQLFCFLFEEKVKTIKEQEMELVNGERE